MRDHEPVSELAKLFTYTDQTQYGRVIVQTTNLERMLERLLKAKMVNGNSEFRAKMFSGYGPLATFSAKIDMCYGLGILDRTMMEKLHHMRAVRNAFAHSDDIIDFAHQSFKSKEKIKNNPLAANETAFFVGAAEIFDYLLPKLETAVLVQAIKSHGKK
ncbi:DUF4145 domain-containing protein [Agrobacterium sp. DE0009]|uniref:DUF4145 domain-containing protein n=1 Tax=Agrobacterium sp. DE0009 TaxID=2587505 RepID=UPI0011A78D40|nr:DUF4145 domain-containing protein [Agrobacterium sp. DE0009]